MKSKWSVWRGKMFLLGWCIRKNMVGLVAVSPQKSLQQVICSHSDEFCSRYATNDFSFKYLDMFFYKKQTPCLKEVEERESRHQVRNLTKMETPPVDVAPMVPSGWLLNGGIPIMIVTDCWRKIIYNVWWVCCFCTYAHTVHINIIIHVCGLRNLH